MGLFRADFRCNCAHARAAYDAQRHQASEHFCVWHKRPEDGRPGLGQGIQQRKRRGILKGLDPAECRGIPSWNLVTVIAVAVA